MKNPGTPYAECPDCFEEITEWVWSHWQDTESAESNLLPNQETQRGSGKAIGYICPHCQAIFYLEPDFAWKIYTKKQYDITMNQSFSKEVIEACALTIHKFNLLIKTGNIEKWGLYPKQCFCQLCLAAWGATRWEKEKENFNPLFINFLGDACFKCPLDFRPRNTAGPPGCAHKTRSDLSTAIKSGRSSKIIKTAQNRLSWLKARFSKSGIEIKRKADNEENQT